MNELVSIIVPCFNQGKFLDQALASVLAQTYHHWECIVINDGSTDVSTEVIGRSYASRDGRFRYYEQRNQGVGAARNLGLDQVRGNFIRFLDADDWLSPLALEKAMKVASQGAIVLGQSEAFLEEEKKCIPYHYTISDKDLTFDQILMYFGERFDIPIHSASFPAILLSKFRFNNGLAVGEDWVMWLHLFKNSPEVIILDDVVAWYRKWPGSATGQFTNSLYQQFICIQYIIRNFKVDEQMAFDLNIRIIGKLTSKIATLEHDIEHLRSSTSFRLGNFVVKNTILLNSIIKKIFR